MVERVVEVPVEVIKEVEVVREVRVEAPAGGDEGEALSVAVAGATLGAAEQQRRREDRAAPV